MDFKVEQKKHPNVVRYNTAEFKVAKSFAERIKKELGDFLKSVVR